MPTQTTEYRFQPPRSHLYGRGQPRCEGQCLNNDPTGRRAHNPSLFRSRLSQVLANVSSYLLILDLCIAYSFPTVIIAALMDAEEGIAVNHDEASWLGSIAYIFQPLGSVMSGTIVEFFGRKWSMIIVNLPFLVGWILYSVSNSLAMLYATNVIIGIGIGFMEAPIMTYIAETCQPDMRAVLTSIPSVVVQCSFFITYVMGMLTSWKTTAAINVSLPIITVIYVSQMPETPIWLLSRGRVKDAERSLCWLRGWVTPDVVKEEFSQLVKYNNSTKKGAMDNNAVIQLTVLNASEDTADLFDQENIDHSKPEADQTENNTAQANEEDSQESHCSLETWKEMLRRPTLRPLILVNTYFLVQSFGGMASIRPYMVHVFREYGMHDEAEWITVGAGVLGVIGSVTLVLTVHWLGKRLISLLCMTGNAVCCLLLGVYSYVVLYPDGVPEHQVTWMPLTLFILFFFFSSTMFHVPWMMLSEVFPFRTRGIATGFSAAVCYVFLFTTSKTYLDMESTMHLHGVFFFFSAVNFFAIVFVYFRLPRMEGKSLEEIEAYFSGQNKKGFLKK
ncbi:facilitated trehalose transporter Tret1-like [Periplaneta americana]|uniref:facilitated trehalose transporter Tret1-like n=1 Tax=Periplaneta americana TaxID=6978 RepID=UPI0037E908BE